MSPHDIISVERLGVPQMEHFGLLSGIQIYNIETIRLLETFSGLE
jgi:hypothetical protein